MSNEGVLSVLLLVSFPEIIASVEASFRDLGFFYNQLSHTDTPPSLAAGSTPPGPTLDIQPAANGETGAGLQPSPPEDLPSYADDGTPLTPEGGAGEARLSLS